MDTLRCPACGETTKQMFHGWKDSVEIYRCGHCNKKYTVEANIEDIALSSQLGFKINEEADREEDQ
uniref:Uncharacterized protein n=1 Tax=viral metagenome TaxID=1070528 RepID=A0A6M3M152_9ZZZZ